MSEWLFSKHLVEHKMHVPVKLLIIPKVFLNQIEKIV